MARIPRRFTEGILLHTVLQFIGRIRAIRKIRGRKANDGNACIPIVIAVRRFLYASRSQTFSGTSNPLRYSRVSIWFAFLLSINRSVFTSILRN